MKNILSYLKDDKIQISNKTLRKLNLAFGVIIAGQGIALLLLSVPHNLPLLLSYLTTDSLQTMLTHQTVALPATHQLLSINLAYVVAAVLFIAAIIHILNATLFRKQYEAGLLITRNYLRWIGYALTGGLTVSVIGMLAGIYDLGTLIAIFALTAVAALLGLAMEVYNPLSKRNLRPNWLISNIGIIAGLIPWIVIALTIIATNIFGSARVPNFVYWLYASLFLVNVIIAVNLYLQFAKKGSWKNYQYGEIWYMIWGFLVVTLLAWQLFAGVLRP